MSKFIKVMISILLIGIVMTIGGYLAGGLKSFAITSSGVIFDEKKTLKSESHSISDVNKIKIDVNYIDKIEIVTSDEFKLDIDTYDIDNNKRSIKYDITDGELRVKEEYDDPVINFNLGFATTNSKEKIKISVPKDISLEDINVTSDSSKISISDVLLKKLNVKCDYGNIDMKNINTDGDVSINATHGNISVNDISCNKLTTDCDYGKISGRNVKVNNVNVDTDSGKFDVSLLTVADLMSIKNKYGDIKIDNGDINKLNIDADSTEIKINSIGLNSVQIKNNYNDVTIDTTEKDELFNYNLKCDYKKIKVNGNSCEDNYIRNTNAPKNINIDCNSGDIKVNTGK